VSAALEDVLPLGDESGRRVAVVLGAAGGELRVQLGVQGLGEGTGAADPQLALDLPVRDGRAGGEAAGQLPGRRQDLLVVVE
jgi:hypothetical protein